MTASMQALVDVEQLEEAVRSYLPQLGRALLFMGHLRTLRFLRWGPEASQPQLLSQVSLHALLSCNGAMLPQCGHPFF